MSSLCFARTIGADVSLLFSMFLSATMFHARQSDQAAVRVFTTLTYRNSSVGYTAVKLVSLFTVTRLAIHTHRRIVSYASRAIEAQKTHDSFVQLR